MSYILTPELLQQSKDCFDRYLPLLGIVAKCPNQNRLNKNCVNTEQLNEYATGVALTNTLIASVSIVETLDDTIKFLEGNINNDGLRQLLYMRDLAQQQIVDVTETLSAFCIPHGISIK